MSHASPPAPRASSSDADRAPRHGADPQPRDPRDSRDASPDAQRDERVSILCGERLCIGCAFNLSGQPVVREPHYRMLIVRCPECGTAAALQEYPALGKWAGRWSAIAAALYLLVLLAGMFAAGGAGFGFSMAAADDLTTDAGLAIARLQEQELGARTPGAGSTARGVSSWDPIDPAWLAKQDLAALRQRVAPWPTVVMPRATPIWVSAALVAACFGVVAAVALPGVSRWRLPLASLAPASITAFFCWQRWIAITAGGGARTEAHELAERMLGPGVWGATIAVLMVAMTVGLVIGRPVARGVVRALLPPRLAGSFSMLWSCDGLTLRPGAPSPPRRS